MSSPHARGSSPLVREAGPRVHVVPARAGIFPSRGHGDTSPRRRPRTRGDLPRARTSGSAAVASSPHARGSSGTMKECTVSENVVPARAGIFRRWPGISRRRRRRPRTRGDLPAYALAFGTVPESSPHARGSSGGRQLVHQLELVVPARAGIFRAAPRSARRRQGRPRTRGDLPTALSSGLVATASSPHARGSSVAVLVGRHHEDVVPARAGIFRATTTRTASPPCRPRTRGDLPLNGPLRITLGLSSPHARGSSVPTSWVRHGCLVVPARAGIFPTAAPGRSRMWRRPRTRGDLPVPGLATVRVPVSSPHARGSSITLTSRHGGRVVVPARAGIFPGGGAAGCPRAGRPRTRGDLPPLVCVSRWRIVSSPHARGSS